LNDHSRRGFDTFHIGYTAPEVASSQGTDEKADVFCYGLIIYEIVSGQTHLRPNAVNDKGAINEMFE
jgi:hypothetical protein